VGIKTGNVAIFLDSRPFMATPKDLWMFGAGNALELP
jgi:hypothetical protein